MICTVTGGLGFIGRQLVARLLKDGHQVYDIDAQTYAAQSPSATLEEYFGVAYRPVTARLENLDRLPDCQVVFHLAAETHVDNSIGAPLDFINSNILGTFRLLELIRGKELHARPWLVHVSTDEVYGDVPDSERGGGNPDLLRPSSPYSVAKAASDLLVQGWRRTYGLRVAIVRPSNCYGSGQYPEKLIPKTIRCLQLGQKIPMHGQGTQTRQWLHVDDLVDALLIVGELGQDGEVYNVLGNTETRVLDIVREIVYAYHDGVIEGGNWMKYVEHSLTRPGMDIRYSVDDSKLRSLGWEPKHNLWRDLPILVQEERQTLRW